MAAQILEMTEPEDFTALLRKAKAAFAADPEYLVDMTNSAQRILKKREKRAERKLVRLNQDV